MTATDRDFYGPRYAEAVLGYFQVSCYHKPEEPLNYYKKKVQNREENLFDSESRSKLHHMILVIYFLTRFAKFSVAFL